MSIQRRLSVDEIFGISSVVPQHNYVDRASLDERFRDLVNSGSHLVIHGASKQGKTVLRRKNMPDEKCIKVQCVYTSDLTKIYAEIMRQAGVSIPTERNQKFSGSASVEGEIPIIKGHGKLEGSTSTSYTFQGATLENINYIAEVIKKSGKKVVIEDFHYLPMDQRQAFASHLKALWDCSVSLVIVGVWQEENLLSYYNGDLSGRIEEIDVVWTKEELLEVISKGSEKLNIKFSEQIQKSILNDSNGNVGLLQLIAKKLCFASGIRDNSQYGRVRMIGNPNALANCRHAVCKELVPRYRLFSEQVSRGFQKNSTQIYEGVLRVCMEAKDEELCSGIHRDIIRERLVDMGYQVELSALTKVLEKLLKLQVERKVSPVVLSYNTDSRTVQLVDRDLLFFRKYIGESNLPWPWLSNE